MLGGSNLSPGRLRTLVQAAAVKLAHGSAGRTLCVCRAKAAASCPRPWEPPCLHFLCPPPHLPRLSPVLPTPTTAAERQFSAVWLLNPP